MGREHDGDQDATARQRADALGGREHAQDGRGERDVDRRQATVDPHIRTEGEHAQAHAGERRAHDGHEQPPADRLDHQRPAHEAEDVTQRVRTTEVDEVSRHQPPQLSFRDRGAIELELRRGSRDQRGRGQQQRESRPATHERHETPSCLRRPSESAPKHSASSAASAKCAASRAPPNLDSLDPPYPPPE